MSRIYPRFYTMCHVSDPIGAAALYCEAFGAVVTDDTRLPNGDPYISISINGADILVRPGDNQAPPKDCCVQFASVADCTKAYDLLTQGGTGEETITDAHWTPLMAQVTDKYGVHWLLSVNDGIKGNLVLTVRRLVELETEHPGLVDSPLLAYAEKWLTLEDKLSALPELKAALTEGLDVDFTGTRWEKGWLANGKVCKCEACVTARECLSDLELNGV